MIDIEIKLNPYGQDLECTPIGNILIANTGRWVDKTLPPTHSKHNYYNYVCVLGDGTFRIVRRHDRAENIYALLARCLAVEAKVEASFLTKVEKDTITRLLERLD